VTIEGLVRVREMAWPKPPGFYRKTVARQLGTRQPPPAPFGLLEARPGAALFPEERGDDIDFDAVIEAVVERHAGINRL